MSCLHDRPLLDPSDISGALSGNDLASQIERVRLTPLPQSVEELSKLWTAIGSGYRLSVDSIDLAGRNLAGSVLRIDGGPLLVPFTVTGTVADDGLALKIPALTDDPTAMATWAPGVFAIAALSP